MIVIPSCTIGKNHSWKKSGEVYGETGICVKCGYDKFGHQYRKKVMENENESDDCQSGKPGS